MTRVAAAAETSLAINQGLYVPPPNAIADVVVRHLEIDPTSRHLVVGSIGSGKTTQLLVATEALNALPDMCAAYIDISRKQDLVKLRPGCLVALAGLALLDQLGPSAGRRPIKCGSRTGRLDTPRIHVPTRATTTASKSKVW